jgi:predicted transposase/invertase (TIGR01784 family)
MKHRNLNKSFFEDRYIYTDENGRKVYRDWKNTIETAELKAEKKGRIKGKMEEKKEMAQKMLQRGFSLDDIAAITNLQLPFKST